MYGGIMKRCILRNVLLTIGFLVVIILSSCGIDQSTEEKVIRVCFEKTNVKNAYSVYSNDYKKNVSEKEYVNKYRDFILIYDHKIESIQKVKDISLGELYKVKVNIYSTSTDNKNIKDDNLLLNRIYYLIISKENNKYVINGKEYLLPKFENLIRDGNLEGFKEYDSINETYEYLSSMIYLLLNKNDKEMIDTVLNKLYSLYPEYDSALYIIAYAYSRLGQNEMEIMYWDKYLSLYNEEKLYNTNDKLLGNNDSYIQVLCNIALTYYVNGQIKKYKDKLNEAEKIGTEDNIEILTLKGKIAFREDRYKDANNYLTKVVDTMDISIKNGVSVDTRFYSALCYNISVSFNYIGDKENAKKYIKKAIEQSMDNPIYKSYLNEL